MFLIIICAILFLPSNISFKYLKFSFDAEFWPFIMLNLNSFQMREVIYSRDQRVNRHKFDGVDPIVLYPFIIGSDLSFRLNSTFVLSWREEAKIFGLRSYFMIESQTFFGLSTPP